MMLQSCSCFDHLSAGESSRVAKVGVPRSRPTRWRNMVWQGQLDVKSSLYSCQSGRITRNMIANTSILPRIPPKWRDKARERMNSVDSIVNTAVVGRIASAHIETTVHP